MAGRPIGKRHQDDVRAKIQASQIINRLVACGMGEVELSAVQVSALKAVLDKAVSNAPTDANHHVTGGLSFLLDEIERKRVA